MRLKTLAVSCTLGLMAKPLYAAYNCYDYCNAGALQMIEQGYVLHGQLLAGWGMSGLAGLATELRYSNNNLMVTGQLGTTLSEYARKVDATNMQSALNSYAEIRKRLSMAVSEHHLRRSYPVDKAAQSVNALGQIITADGLSKAGEAGNVRRADDASNPAASGNGGQGQNPQGSGQGNTNGKPDNKNPTASQDKKPLNFNGSPEENAQALFEVFNRLKLTTTGVQAIAYVNPLTSRNLGAQPNQIYTIYTQRPMGNPYQEEVGWPGRETELSDPTRASADEQATSPHLPESVFAVWMQNPIVDPQIIDSIFNRHAVDIEMFEVYKKYSQQQTDVNAINNTSAPVGIFKEPQSATDPGSISSGKDAPKPPLASAQNEKPFTAQNSSLAQLGTQSCGWSKEAHANYHRVGSARDKSAAQTAKNRGKSNANIILELAQKNNFPPAILMGVAWVESKFDPTAKAPNSSATGMFQFLKGTASMSDPFAVHTAKIAHADRTDPYQNTQAAINYLTYILNRTRPKNDIFMAVGSYHDGHGYANQPHKIYSSKGAVPYIKNVMCITKLMLLHDLNPQPGANTTFNFATDIHLITALGYSANGSKFYLPLSGATFANVTDEYGMEKYGIFVENANAYRNVERTDLSLLFSWLALQYNSDLTAEILGKVFAHMDEPPSKGDVGIDKSIEASSGIAKTEKQEKLGIGNEMVTKSKDGKSNSVKPGSSIHEELVNNYAQYLSAYWFDPVVIPPGVYPDTDRMTTAQLNKFYTYVRKRLEMGGTPTRVGTDRVPLQVLKALAEGGNEAYQIAFAQSVAAEQKPPPREQYESPHARNWIAEATISELHRGLVNATLVDMLEFRLRPDKSSWPSYNSMALHMVQHPDDLGKVISPSLALDMALYSAYNPVKHLITPEEALKLRSYYSHGYYPFMRYYGDESTPVGEEPNRITEQVVLEKTVNYIRDPKFYEFMETASGDDLNRQLPRYVGTESYIAYRRLKEAHNRRRLLIAWAGAAVANGYSTDSGNDDTSIGMEERISRTGREATATGNVQ